MTYISQKSRISVVNSTDVALNAAAGFTGTVEDVSNYESMAISCKTDKDGSMMVDFSTNGTNWDSTSTTCTVADNNQIIYSAKLTNGGGQLTFAFTDDIILQPGDTLTIAGRVVGGTASNLIYASLNTREDQ